MKSVRLPAGRQGYFQIRTASEQIFHDSTLQKKEGRQMETTDIFKKVKEIVVNQLEVKENRVIAEAKFVDDLGADSLDTMEMIMTFEKQYEIEILDEDVEGLLTVKDVVDYIQRRLKQKRENDRLYPTYSI